MVREVQGFHSGGLTPHRSRLPQGLHRFRFLQLEQQVDICREQIIPPAAAAVGGADDTTL